jgi:hypothetical protein
VSAPIFHCEYSLAGLFGATINFSKKTGNHRHVVALFAAHFNFCRVHKSLGGKTPAMAAELTDHVWTVEELLVARN